MGMDVLYVEGAADHRLQPDVTGISFRDVEPGVAQVANARSVKELLNLVNDLSGRGIPFKSLTDNIDTSTLSGLFFHVMASLAQMEREFIVERTRAGLTAARLQGCIGGRKRSMTDSKIDSAKKLLATGIAPKEVAQNLGISVPTLYRWVPASTR